MNENVTQINDIGDKTLNGCAARGRRRLHDVEPGPEPDGNGTDGTVSGNIVTSYKKNGIDVRGNVEAVTISGNTVTGAGRVAYIAQNGIEV